MLPHLPRRPDATPDVVVVGAGPAGRAAAAACAEAELETVLVDPDPDRHWRHTYAAWDDELPSWVGAAARAHVWSDVRLRTDDLDLALNRSYTLLDNVALQTDLRRRFTAAGGRQVTGSVEGLQVAAAHLIVQVRGRQRQGQQEAPLRCRAVVDASGHRPVLLHPAATRPPALQTAYGLVGRHAVPPARAGAMTFMDWSTPWRDVVDRPTTGRRGARDAPPSFLYAMDLGEGRWLVEETSLAARPALPLDVLAARLDDRLHATGSRPQEVEVVERVVFPMGVAVPDRRQPVIGFGAAAGMIHPATGFQVARSLREAPTLAAALAEAVRAGADVAHTARAGWASVWSTDALRQRALHQIGLESLLTMDSEAMQQFFAAFFSLDVPQWSSYVSGADSAQQLARVMARVFRAVPRSRQRTLVSSVVRRPSLVAAAVAPRSAVSG